MANSRDERRRRNGITPENEKKQPDKIRIAELEAENAELRIEVAEAQDALVELADIMAGGE